MTKSNSPSRDLATSAGAVRHLGAHPERWAFPQAFVIHTLATGAHAACQLAHPLGFPRSDVDRTLRWLQRRKLVEYDGAWKLTELGRIAAKHSHVTAVRSEATITDDGCSSAQGEARSEGIAQK